MSSTSKPTAILTDICVCFCLRGSLRRYSLMPHAHNDCDRLYSLCMSEILLWRSIWPCLFIGVAFFVYHRNCRLNCVRMLQHTFNLLELPVYDGTTSQCKRSGWIVNLGSMLQHYIRSFYLNDVAEACFYLALLRFARISR